MPSPGVARGALLALVTFGCAAGLLYAGEHVLLKRTGQSWLFNGWNDLGPTVYDPLLGWTSPASTEWPDLYGPGRHCTYNARAFRATEEHERATPEGRFRALCLGDSFMDGLGLDDSTTIPAQLERLRPEIQAVNMAKISYGLDQAVLRYERDAAELDADAVVLGVIDDDLNRARWDYFFSYWPKPRFRVASGGELELSGAPVPDFSAPIRSPADLFRRSGLFLLPRQYFAERTYGQDDAALARGILDRLRKLAGERGQEVVLAYLPTRPEVESGEMLPLAGVMEAYAQRHGLSFVQGASAFTGMTDKRQAFLEVNDHYSALGAALVAKVLLDALSGDRGLGGSGSS